MPADPAPPLPHTLDSALDTGQLIRQLAEGASDNLPSLRQQLAGLMKERKTVFVRAAIEYLASGPDGSGAEAVCEILALNDCIVPALGDPSLALEGAVAIAGVAARSDESLDKKLLTSALRDTHPGGAHKLRLARTLEILTHVSSGARILPQMLMLMRHPDERVRSKAALLISRGKKDIRWLEGESNHSDPRIRANAVEALWGESSKDALKVFTKAAADPHHRVAGNALVGLFLAGDSAAAAQLEQMAGGESPEFQAAAAWAMGRCGGPEFLPTLTKLVRSGNPTVKRPALKAMVEIRKKNNLLGAGGPAPAAGET